MSADLVGDRAYTDEGAIVASVTVNELEEWEQGPIMDADEGTRVLTAKYRAHVLGPASEEFTADGATPEDALDRLLAGIVRDLAIVQKMRLGVVAYRQGRAEL